MRPVLGIAAYALQILACGLLLLALLPVLYPYVSAIGVSIVLLALLILALYPAHAADAGVPTLKREPAAEPAPRRFSREWIASRGTTRRAWRAARLSTIAVVIVLVLYTAMRLHSRIYYEEPFNRELDPLRDAFRSAAPALMQDPAPAQTNDSKPDTDKPTPE